MNVEQLGRLARRAEGVPDRADDRLREVHTRIRRARRRRTTGAVVGAGAVVAACALGASMLTGSSDPAPNPAPRPDRDEPAAVSVRALTWTDEFWPSRRINYGDEVIDTRLDLTKHDFAQMDTTDDGVVVTTTDGRIWFADTGSVEQIGDSRVSHSFLSLSEVSTGNAGSLAAWFEPEETSASPKGAPALVVYDTSLRREVARVKCHLRGCSVLWVGADRVYVGTTSDGLHVDRIRRLDVGAGVLTDVSRSAYAADLRSQPRNLVTGDSFEAGAVSDGIEATFARQGSRLVALTTRLGGEPTTAFDVSGRPLQLRVPDGYDGARSFTVFQWLDDDRLAMMAGAGGMGFVPGMADDLSEDSTGYGDIMVCRISTGVCLLDVPGPKVPADVDESEPFDGEWLRIVPDYGTPGTN